jgi:hypothetical protein
MNVMTQDHVLSPHTQMSLPDSEMNRTALLLPLSLSRLPDGLPSVLGLEHAQV